MYTRNITLLVAFLGLLQLTACDSGGDSDPDIRGVWTGSAIVPNAPFEIAINFRIEITDEDFSGTGFYTLETSSVFRTTQVTLSGAYVYPLLGMEIVGEDGRTDVFSGEIDETGSRFVGQLITEILPIPELSPTGALRTMGGETEITFTRVSN